MMISTRKANELKNGDVLVCKENTFTIDNVWSSGIFVAVRFTDGRDVLYFSNDKVEIKA